MHISVILNSIESYAFISQNWFQWLQFNSGCCFQNHLVFNNFPLRNLIVKTFVVTMNCFDLKGVLVIFFFTGLRYFFHPYKVGEIPYIISLVCSSICRYNYSSFLRFFEESSNRKTCKNKWKICKSSMITGKNVHVNTICKNNTRSKFIMRDMHYFFQGGIFSLNLYRLSF